MGELGFEPIVFNFKSQHATLEVPRKRSGHSIRGAHSIVGKTRNMQVQKSSKSRGGVKMF